MSVNEAVIGSNDVLSCVRPKAIIWSNARPQSIEPLMINILAKTQQFKCIKNESIILEMSTDEISRYIMALHELNSLPLQRNVIWGTCVINFSHLKEEGMFTHV